MGQNYLVVYIGLRMSQNDLVGVDGVENGSE